MAEKIFADGLIFKKKRDGAPDFVKGGVSIKVEDFVAFLQKHKKEDGWVNLDLLKAKEKDSLYFSLNDWKPEAKTGGVGEPEDPSNIPF